MTTKIDTHLENKIRMDQITAAEDAVIASLPPELLGSLSEILKTAEERRAFAEFPKMARWSRDIVITEKIDGTNAQVFIFEDGVNMRVGSRSRWITPEDDNHGFAKWCEANREELLKLGPGRHFGEWWGSGIQRGYGLTKGDKRFSLFNTSRWSDDAVRPTCCHVVPVLYSGPNTPGAMEYYLANLELNGSEAAHGFMDPEGVVMFHTAANVSFKKTIKKDEMPKSFVKDAK